ncbi:glycoside hydrolase family 3 protein [Fictibacillus sp. S7]|uniref:glycoside hydrolase family 3 protein n=1 Tax=Fictibacillus sp. S7 TaxID=2212476 RepID=UPI0013E98AE2|nr:glycoside hydrolase family 3 protein [Fictibacillus sp. S7]
MKKMSAFISTVLIGSTLLLPLSAGADELKGNADPPKSPKDKVIEQIIANMTAKEKIGQLVMPSTHDNESKMPNEDTRKLIQNYKAGSVIVYGARNARTTAQYNNQLQKWAANTSPKLPLLVSADLEFGTKQHVTDATPFPRQMGIGATRQAKAAKDVAKITALEAKATGFNWNYSPVADVNTNPANPVIGVRSFGEKTSLVSSMTAAQIKGYQENGVVATAKHFPGHGDTSVDSHLGLAAVTYDRETLETVHLPPFQAAIDAGVDSIMTAHVIINAIDKELPATLSKKVLTGLLRNEMGFKGLIVTDAMSMHAIAKEWGAGQAAVMAVNAGADIVMATGNLDEQLETFDALSDALKSGQLSEKRVNESVKRVLALKIKYKLFGHRYVDPEGAVNVVNQPAHKETAAEVARKSITLVKNENVLPFHPAEKKLTLVTGPQIYGSTNFINNIASMVDEKSAGNVKSFTTSEDATTAEIQQAVKLAEQADQIIVPTFSPSELPAGQAKLVKELQKTGKPVVAVSLGLPYDVKEYPEVGAYISTYSVERWGSPVPTSWKAAIDVIFGTQPGGKLPVSIEGLYPYGTGLNY